jgi:7,8-dihydropterin-6-yl-methyl-4-(beta-D-ribofuranosyl)aminobenzene 5'-phosphate synthase
MSRFRITVLSDDCVSARSARAEHGVGFHIETGDRRILFDTGQGLVLADNARALGIDLGAVDTLVFSHGHYDHTGGLPIVLSAVRKPVDVHLHPDAMQAKFHVSGSRARSIGIPDAARLALDGPNARVIASRDPGEIAPGLFRTGEIPRPHPEEALAELFHLDTEGQAVDPLLDDQSLYMESATGTVVLLGCAHAGVIHILEHVRRLTGKRPIRAVIGGMHLGGADDARIRWVTDQLRHFSPALLVPMHCTGPRAAAALWTAFPEACRPGGAGAVFEL